MIFEEISKKKLENFFQFFFFRNRFQMPTQLISSTGTNVCEWNCQSLQFGPPARVTGRRQTSLGRFYISLPPNHILQASLANGGLNFFSR